MCKESTKTQTTSLPQWLDTASQGVVDKATKLADTPFKEYTGQRVADMTADQQSAFQKIRDLIANAPQVAGDAIGGAREYADAAAQKIGTERSVDQGGRLGAFQDYMNPYVTGAINPAVQKIMDAAAAQRKQIGAGATAAGAFGDARHGIAEGQLNLNTQRSVGETVGSMMMSAADRAAANRQTDLGRFLDVDKTNAAANETALARKLTGTGAILDRAAQDQDTKLKAIQSLLSSGTIQQTNKQAGLDAMFQEFMRGQTDPFMKLQALSDVLRGVPHGSTTTSTSPDNTGMGLLGGALGSFAGSAAGSQAIATGASAALSSLGPLLAMI